MKKIASIVGRILMLFGAGLAGAFCLIFAHGGGVHWKEQNLLGKFISGLAFVVLGIPFVVGFPLAWVGDHLMEFSGERNE